MPRLPPIVAVAALGAIWAAPAAEAAVFTVDSTGPQPDASQGNGICAASTAQGPRCTLTAAIQEANAFAGTDDIVVSAGTYVAPGAAPFEITSGVTLSGAGARATIVGAGGDSAVFRITSGSVEIRDVAIVGGVSTDSGGGIRVGGADLILERVAVQNNRAVGSGLVIFGGGISVDPAGSLWMLDSTVADNRAEIDGGEAVGGGISSEGSMLLENVTVSGNTAHATGTGANSFAGGVFNRAVSTFRHVTLAGNAATGTGFLYGSNFNTAAAPDQVTLIDSVITDGIGTTNCAADKPVEQGRNLDSDGSCAIAQGPSGVAALLEPLGDRGGPTDTRPPQPGSPARDAAAGCMPGGRDQRGQTAPLGGACDLGAVELGSDAGASIVASAASVAPGEPLTYVAALTNAGLDATPASTLELTPPAGAEVTFVSGSPGSCTTGATIVCGFGALARGFGGTVTVVVRAPATGPLVASARASGPLPDPAAGNDVATVTTDVPQPGGSGGAAGGAGAGGEGGSGGAGGGDALSPGLSGLGLRGRFTARRGGTLRHTLSEPATLRIRLDRLLAGRRRGSRCVARGTGRRCTRVVRVGERTVNARAGASTTRLPVRWGRNRLTTGRHRITVTATDAAGNRAAPARINVRVVR